MDSVHLDTHVVVWLFAAGDALDLLSPGARERIEGAERLRVSPIVLLELALLRETGRVRNDPHEILGSLRESVGLEIAPESFAGVAAESVRQGWTRDPFDRIIAAQAVVAGAELVTRDRTIREHLPLAVW